MNKSVFNWEIRIRICNKTRELKTDSNADSVAATRRGDQLLLVYRSGDKLLQPVARHVAGTDRVVCSGEFVGNLCLSNRILSTQNVAQIQSDLILCDLLRRQNSVAETKISRKVLHYRDLSLRFVDATCCCKYAFCMMASFYYYDQNPLRFSFHTLIWYSQSGFETKSPNLHKKAKS